MDTAPLHEVAHCINDDDLREALIRLLGFTTQLAAEVERLSAHPELPCPRERPE